MKLLALIAVLAALALSGINPYDRIGHFMQGFVPAVIARELLLRGGFVSRRGMVAFLSICVALAFSAFYFLGTQGDPWDTQADMFLALLGATVALAALSRLHDRQIERL